MKGKPAKVLGQGDLRRVLGVVKHARYATRDRAIVLLSVKAGLRACEISSLTWPMVTDARGNIGTVLELPAVSAKMGSGRRIPLNPELRKALAKLKAEGGIDAGPVIVSERGTGMTAKSIVNWFLRLYRAVGLSGCSSHSGRRTFVTRGAQLVFRTGGSLRDIQELAGHRSIKTTEAYIEGNRDAQRRLIRLI